MTSGNPNKPLIYPDYCHVLSPTIGKWCPLRAVDVHSLRSMGMFDDGKEIFYHGNHPIKYARIIGVVVAIDDFSTRRIYTIDDSSGMCIECTCPSPTPVAAAPSITIAMDKRLNNAPHALTILGQDQSKDKAPTAAKSAASSTPSTAAPLVPWDDLEVGIVIKIKGKPSHFRSMKQIEIVKAEVVRSTEQEVKCWNEALQFRKDILSVPWVVSPGDEESLRRKAAKEKQFPRGKGKDRRKEESEDDRKKRKEVEKRSKQEETKQRTEKRSGERLDPRNKVNHPSLAMRKMLAEKVRGKYDALGI